MKPSKPAGNDPVKPAPAGATPAPPADGSAPESELYRLVSKQPFFKGLGARHLQILANLAMEMEFKPGRYIIREGDPSNRFYLILAGKVELQSEAAEQEMIPVQTLGPGDDLGWSWLFPPYTFRASGQAVEPTKTIFFYGTRLRQQCEEDHDLGYEIMKRIAQVAIHNMDVTHRTLVARAGQKDCPPGTARK
jgi:CRP/FNR family cyclic AMP-dependent transcriptional regulator